MDMFLQQLLNGLTLGGIYSLVALGLTLVYGILAVPNFAHGAFYMVGAFVSFYLMSRLGWNYWLAMIGSGLAVAVLAILAERLVFHPLRKSSELHPMIAAIMGCNSEDLRSGWNTSRSARIASRATARPEPIIASQ